MTAPSGDLADMADVADVADVAEVAEIDRLVASVELAHARRLARAGHYTEAGDVLALARATPAGLDLRARMAAQQRRYDEAVALWHEAAAQRGEPDAYAAELAAVERLRNRRSGLGAVPRVAAVVVLGGALAAGAGWVAAHRWSASDDGTVADAQDDVTTTTTTTATSTTTAPVGPTGGASANEPGVLEQRLRSVAGVEVTARDDGPLEIAFTEPVFSDGVVLTPAGEAALTDLAAVLTSSESDGDQVIVVVTGHTDALPLRPGSRYADNDELALARARVGVAWLVLGGLPAERTTVDVTPAGPLDRTIGLAVYQQDRR